ncbi:MAG: RNA polymerase sigma factor [Bacteroidales bacterium]|nr:RNA polymerase sigma factor [Bacteroidales bacterium]
MTTSEYNLCIDQHADKIYRFILKSTNDEELSKDIMQDTFEKLWVKVNLVDFEKAKSYLFTTAYHSMIDMFRKEKRKREYENNNFGTESHHDQYVDLNEQLHAAIKLLPEIQRTVILLRDYEGYSYSEITEITNLSESQVKVYIYRGRVFLKKYIGSIEAVI